MKWKYFSIKNLSVVDDPVQFLKEYYIDEFKINFNDENTTSTTSTTPNGTTISTPTTLSPTTSPEELSSGFIILALFLGIFGGFGCVILIGVILIKRKLKKHNASQQQSSRNNNAYEMNTYNQSEAWIKLFKNYVTLDLVENNVKLLQNGAELRSIATNFLKFGFICRFVIIYFSNICQILIIIDDIKNKSRFCAVITKYEYKIHKNVRWPKIHLELRLYDAILQE